MKILQLIIKEHFLSDIVAGKKIIETREIRPKNAKKYVVQTDEDVYPIKYDAIQFYVGYNTDRKKALVEVKDAEIVILADKDGNDLVFVENEIEYLECIIIYNLAKVLNHNFH